jgi:hypothetical protein
MPLGDGYNPIELLEILCTVRGILIMVSPADFNSHLAAYEQSVLDLIDKTKTQVDEYYQNLIAKAVADAIAPFQASIDAGDTELGKALAAVQAKLGAIVPAAQALPTPAPVVAAPPEASAPVAPVAPAAPAAGQ